MVFNCWQIGLEIQPGSVRAIAVQRQRQGWQLRQWWHIPLAEEVLRGGILQQPDTLCDVLSLWRRELPLRHQLRVALPTQRILQRRVTAPDNRLREEDRSLYIASATAGQLQMSSQQLCWDYGPASTETDQVIVTAARQADVAQLLSCLARLRLFPASVTPGACALPALACACCSQDVRYVVHQDGQYWLWAENAESARWGHLDRAQIPDFLAVCQHLSASSGDIAFSSAEPQPLPDGAVLLDGWRVLSRLQPPLPVHPGLFTVALGLAIGRVKR